MKPLPYIAIEGVGKTKEEVLDSLIAIEPLLVMMMPSIKFDDDDAYTTERFITTHILTRPSFNDYGYYNHKGIDTPIRFKSTEINKLIKYMIDNKFIK